MIGSRIAHYLVKGRLGAGGMGEVYLANDEKLDRDVALKLLPDSTVADATARARLVREAKLASALNHPNVCHIYEVGEAAGHAYIAMEHVAGRPLAQSIPGDGLPLETTLRYAGQLAEALAHAHDRGVLHRDLKSSNVMITPEGRVKVLDFGLAKRAAPADAANEATRAADSVTQAGSVAGTLHYLAPELLRGQPADARSDLWALGVILYEMASGKLPFTGRTGFEASAAILREMPAPLSAHVPAGVRGIIARCLAKEPAQRYQRAGELRAALEAISSDTATHPVAAATAPAPAATPPPEPAPPKPGVSRTVQSIFASQSATAKESWSVLAIWFAWIAGLIVLWGLYLLVTGQVSLWFSSSRPPQSAGPTQPATGSDLPSSGPGAFLSTGGKPSTNPEANAYLEKSMLFLRSGLDVPRGRQMLERALELDPNFASARFTYALTHVLQIETGASNETAWLYKAEQEVQRALRDDPENPMGNVSRAAIAYMQGSKEVVPGLVQPVITQVPENLGAHIWLGHYYRLKGDYPAAIAQSTKLRQIAPLFWANSLLLGTLLHQNGDPAAAVREFAGILEQDPQNPFALRELARVHLASGDTKTARVFLEKARKEDRQNYRARLAWALLFAREGKRRDAMREMDPELLKYADLHPTYTLEAAEFFAVLGEKRQALDWLEKAVRNGDERVEWFRRNPLLESLRNEFRFKSLLDSIAFRRQQKSP